MAMHILAGLAVVGTLLTAAPVMATTAVYTITGSGTGQLNASDWQGAFTITLTGNLADFYPDPNADVLDPLVSAVVDIPSASGLVIVEATRLGFNYTNLAVFFSRSAFLNSGLDLFDFYLGAPVDLSASFGPVTGSGVFALHQFVNVPTSGGLLTFTSSGDVRFAGVVGRIPEPGTWALLIAGFGLVGFAARRRQTALA